MFIHFLINTKILLETVKNAIFHNNLQFHFVMLMFFLSNVGITLVQVISIKMRFYSTKESVVNQTIFKYVIQNSC